ncbi:MAG: tRNA (adenosine(37)-N6)-threonylcarbamoyltransferase complex dimerization subunit type 1 TsaB, partial [Oscillospiraceae bacterium]
CFVNAGLTHSRTLSCLVADTLSHAGRTFDDVGQLAVSTGPGSYTGLRIGLAAVKGMSLARSIPCAGVSTLLALAYNVRCRDGVVCAVLDARVGQVFAALFDVRGGVVTRLTPDDAMPLVALDRLIPDTAMAVGDGAQMVCRQIPRLVPGPDPLLLQRASSVICAAFAQEIPFVDAGLLQPDYHRKSQAEREREIKIHSMGGTIL